MSSTPSRVPSIPRPPPSPLRPTSGPVNNIPTPSSGSSSSSPAPAPAATAPRRNTGPSTPPPPQKTRARDLLRKHYGLGVGPPPPRPGNTQDPMDLNSTAFDAKSYYEQLITTSSLPALLKRENELLTEIRQLDSERQSLVYNHHHELIAASDTISAMKTRAESLDGDLDLLRAAFSEISRLTAEVSTEGSTKNNGNASNHR
ncbi:Vps51/Vps67-domain-containing protein [Flammula alnicola]|nr:Vps51/Vps67-domain-containing protein [Flammula alnicola]